jgi:hypothetical protein
MSYLVCGRDLAKCPASSDTVKSEGRQMKECLIILKKSKSPPIKFLADYAITKQLYKSLV